MNNPAQNHIDLSHAVIAFPPDLSRREKNSVRMLVEEIEKRTQIRLPQNEGLPPDGTPVIWLSQGKNLPEEWLGHLNGQEALINAEGYLVQHLSTLGQQLVVVAGADERGVLFGAGCLLRSLHMEKQQITLPLGLALATWPHCQLRGHQLGYRDKTNSYCGWDLNQWEQYIRELAIFGTNAIELLPPRTDDHLDSVHFPLPPMETMVGMSQIANDYGLDVWVWYPAMDPDYTDPAAVASALHEWGEVFRQLPRIDAVFVPGGDPGKAPPHILMPVLAQQQHQLVKFHPQAKMWISPQGFSGEWMESFLTILKDDHTDWLYGVVHGPWVNIAMDEFRRMIPERYALRTYPDITHSINCQYPVPNWDVAFALTEGRETINPRPMDEAAIFQATRAGTIGFLTYSEGCNDDVNKFIWSGLGWDPEKPVIEILREYSRFFIGARYAESFAQGLLALERNWRGPLLSNQEIPITLHQFQDMEKAAMPRTLHNWRFLQALYRAYYDAYIRARLIYETSLEEQARDEMRLAVSRGSLRAIDRAVDMLDQALDHPVAGAWRTRIFQLGEALFQTIHMQLSVPLYRAQSEVRGANLDGIDFPLSNGPWLKERLAELRSLPDETSRLAGIDTLLRWCDPGPGGIYLDLGAGNPSPYVVSGLPYEKDPAGLFSPTRKYAYRKSSHPLRLAQHGFTGTLNDQPFQLHFPNLDPLGRYQVRMLYAQQPSHHPAVMLRLDAGDGIEVHPYLAKPTPVVPLTFDIPVEATRGGELTLTWRREPDKGGNGLGCDVSELWLIKYD